MSKQVNFPHVHSNHCIEGQRCSHSSAHCTCRAKEFVKADKDLYWLYDIASEPNNEAFVFRMSDGTWNFIAIARIMGAEHRHSGDKCMASETAVQAALNALDEFYAEAAA